VEGLGNIDLRSQPSLEADLPMGPATQSRDISYRDNALSRLTGKIDILVQIFYSGGDRRPWTNLTVHNQTSLTANLTC